MLRAAVLAVALTALAGCGGSGDPADQARGTVDAFLLDCARGDGATAAETLVAPAREIFVDEAGTRAGCARVLAVRDPGRGEIDGRVTGVAVDSAEARADVQTTAGRSTVTLSFGREGWLIEGPQS